MDSKKNNRVWIFGFAVAFLLVTAFVSYARSERKPRYSLSDGQHLTLVVDSIDYRADLTRMYGKFVGRPHTSQQVKSITLHNGARSYAATDIDGVDFNRWFQWEDDGVIPVEIDFDKMPEVKTGRLVIVTPRGTDSCTMTKQ